LVMRRIIVRGAAKAPLLGLAAETQDHSLLGIVVIPFQAYSH